MTPPAEPVRTIAVGWGPRRVRVALTVLGVTWLVLLGGVAVSKPLAAAVPAVPRFLLQCSCLFPNAAQMRIDYRAEGFSCALDRFVEIDHRPYFPVRADDKESVFHRVGYFYRRNRPVMEQFDAYLVDAHNARAVNGRDPGDGIAGPIGGIRFLSVRIPFPAPGEPVEPYQVLPLRDYPPDWRVPWYMTPPEQRQQRCRHAEVAP